MCLATANKSIPDSLLNTETQASSYHLKPAVIISSQQLSSQASSYHLKRTHLLGHTTSSFGLDRSVLTFLPIITSKFRYDNSSRV